MKDKIIGFFTDVVKEMKKVHLAKKRPARFHNIGSVVCLIIAFFVWVSTPASALRCTDPLKR